MEKRQLIINDFVVRPDSCNFRCKYCLSGEAENLNSGVSFGEPLVYEKNSKLGKRLNSVIEQFKTVFDAPILRISGGELFLINGIEDFLQRQDYYEKIQIITNGSMLNQSRLERLKKIPNCILHVSLDGVLFEQNSNRVSNEKQHKKLTDNLESAVKLGYDIEIGSVLTKNNTGNYAVFLDYLKQLKGKVCAYPFPVRGNSAKRFYPAQQDIDSFSKILDVFPKYKDVLPPKEFLEEVVCVLKAKRTLRCRIPELMIQLFDDGKVSPCPNIWTNSVGNVLTDTKDWILGNLQKDKMYKLFLQKTPRLNCCRLCVTSLDVLNLYCEGRIGFREITSLPLYSGEKTKKLLKNLEVY